VTKKKGEQATRFYGGKKAWNRERGQKSHGAPVKTRKIAEKQPGTPNNERKPKKEGGEQKGESARRKGFPTNRSGNASDPQRKGRRRNQEGKKEKKGPTKILKKKKGEGTQTEKKEGRHRFENEGFMPELLKTIEGGDLRFSGR